MTFASSTASAALATVTLATSAFMRSRVNFERGDAGARRLGALLGFFGAALALGETREHLPHLIGLEIAFAALVREDVLDLGELLVELRQRLVVTDRIARRRRDHRRRRGRGRARRDRARRHRARGRHTRVGRAWRVSRRRRCGFASRVALRQRTRRLRFAHASFYHRYARFWRHSEVKTILPRRASSSPAAARSASSASRSVSRSTNR